MSWTFDAIYKVSPEFCKILSASQTVHYTRRRGTVTTGSHCVGALASTAMTRPASKLISRPAFGVPAGMTTQPPR